ncbi:diguanylate cyclase [Tissierella creatinini]|nr:diguanylate cyclase [Tissierella creatinini]TJX63553.1 diguanylate cyclase [Soehngenia saccharolytica]
MTYSNFTTEELVKLLEERDEEIQKLRNKVDEIAIIDETTSLYNKSFLYKALGYEMSRAQRSQGYLSVLLFGINNFNAIKERYGEEITNIILVQIARLLKISVRDIDIVGRYGDGEYMLILPDMNPNNGNVVAERIQRLMDKEIFPVESRVTLAYGIKSFEGESVNKLINLAETSLNLERKDFNR